MTNAYIVKEGVINNIAVYDSADDIPDGWTEVSGSLAIGDVKNEDGSFTRPDPREE